MKNILKIAILFLACTQIHAQSDHEQNYFKESYTDTFKNESIVIAKLFEEYTFTTAGGPDYKVNVVYRAQYKLKDIKALEVFSTLSKNKDLKRYVLNQVKPDGRVNLIYEYYDKNYPDDGYEEKDEDEDDDKKKEKEDIPLENLEIGDIIDYQFEYTYTTKTKDFRKVILNNGKLEKKAVNVPNSNIYKYLLYKNRLLEDQYPIASGLIIYNVPKELNMVQKSSNCNFSFTSKTVNSKTLYECRLNNIKAFKREDFSYPYLNHPVLKYTLVQTDPFKAVYYPYQFTDGKTDKEDIVALGRQIYKDKKYIPTYLYYLNTTAYPEGYTQASLDKFFKAFLSTFTKNDKDKLEKLNKFHEYLTNNDELNENQFSDMSYAVLMARFCDAIKLPYKMMACMHRYDGKFENIISPYEITWGLYIPNKKGEDVFITSYDKKSNIYELFGSLSGSDILIFNPATLDPSEVIQYPAVDYKRNTLEQHLEVVLSDDPKFEYRFINTYTCKGQQKYAISDHIIGQFRNVDLYTPARFSGMVNYQDIYNEDLSFKTMKSYLNLLKELNRVDSFWKLTIKEYRKGQMLVYLYDEYHFREIEIDSFKLHQGGDYTDNDTAIYGFNIEFKANGIIDKTSSDSMLVMNLGKMISEQYQLSNYKINERLSDVYTSNQRKFTWDIEIELPKNYKCINLDDFKQNFENQAGIFKSEVTEKDGKLVLKVTKIYKTNYLPKEKWVEMVNYLHEAASFFNKKLLLEKK